MRVRQKFNSCIYKNCNINSSNLLNVFFEEFSYFCTVSMNCIYKLQPHTFAPVNNYY